MITEFQRIPDFFIERYIEEIEAWAGSFSKIGPVKSFVLKEGMWSESSPDPEQGAVLIGVKLLATVTRGIGGREPKVIVQPYTDEDERKIEQHCERMQGLGVASRLFTKEPPRPWLPFMPRISTRH